MNTLQTGFTKGPQGVPRRCKCLQIVACHGKITASTVKYTFTFTRKLSSVSFFRNSSSLLMKNAMYSHIVLKSRRRQSQVVTKAMVNVDVSPSVILGVGLIGAGVSLWQIRQSKPWISKDYDVVVSCISLLVGGILIFQGWRLDPLLLFGQLMTTGAAVSFGVEALRLRSEVYEQEEKAQLQDVFKGKSSGSPKGGEGLRLPPPPPPFGEDRFRYYENYGDDIGGQPQYFENGNELNYVVQEQRQFQTSSGSMLYPDDYVEADYYDYDGVGGADDNGDEYYNNDGVQQRPPEFEFPTEYNANPSEPPPAPFSYRSNNFSRRRNTNVGEDWD